MALPWPPGLDKADAVRLSGLVLCAESLDAEAPAKTQSTAGLSLPASGTTDAPAPPPQPRTVRLPYRDD